MESDLEPVRFESFAELYPYCYRVASAVGLACVRVWGVRPGATYEEADAPAEAAGIAFQLTNILRDLGEDLARGRVYLPMDELRGCPPGSWRDPAFGEKAREMIRFQAARALDYYRRSESLNGLLSPAGRGIFRVMSGTYRAPGESAAQAIGLRGRVRCEARSCWGWAARADLRPRKNNPRAAYPAVIICQGHLAGLHGRTRTTGCPEHQTGGGDGHDPVIRIASTGANPSELRVPQKL